MTLSSSVKNNILLTALVRKILFSPLEGKSHIFKPPCNILYIFISQRVGYVPTPLRIDAFGESNGNGDKR